MNKLLLIIFILSSVLLTNCKKYPEGPAFSLKTKKARIVNNWKLSKYLENDVDLTANVSSVQTKFTFSANKDESYTLVRELFNNSKITEKGQWALSSDKKYFKLQPSSISFGILPNSSTWQIIKLFEKEFWLSTYDSNNKKIEYRFIPE